MRPQSVGRRPGVARAHLALASLLAASCSSQAPSGFSGTDSGASLSPFDASALCGHSDCDGDGYSTPADCDDFNAQVNPEAYDFIGDGIDNDCDGTVDDPVVNCETVPGTPPGSPADFARAGDLCAQRSKTNAGTIFDPLVRSAWGQVSGSGGEQVWTSITKPAQVNIVSAFGQNAPRSGKTMLGLANGPWGATDPRGSPALDPAGFHLDDACSDVPLTGLDCDALTNNSPLGAVSVQDWAELTLWVKVPSNAGSMHFDFAFFSSEFNQWWNSSANDAFFALVSSKTIAGTNVARDAHGLAITVNSDFFQLCPSAPGPSGLSAAKAEALQQCVGMSGDADAGDPRDARRHRVRRRRDRDAGHRPRCGRERIPLRRGERVADDELRGHPGGGAPAPDRDHGYVRWIEGFRRLGRPSRVGPGGADGCNPPASLK